MRRALASLVEWNKLQNSLPATAGVLRSLSVQRSTTLTLGANKVSGILLPAGFIATRNLTLSLCSHAKQTTVEEVEGEYDPSKEPPAGISEPLRDPAKDRTKVIPVEVSMRYLESDAYRETYGEEPVWVPYRRNFKGQFAPRLTRRTCIRRGQISTGNPCPICRDEYLVVDYRNVKLLKQFISPFNGEVLRFDKTGLCQTKQKAMLVEITKAMDYGTITFDVPVRKYDYNDYYGDKPRNYL